MAKNTTPTFTHELPLKYRSKLVHELLVRQNLARFIHNACVGEAEKRLGLLWQSKLYQKARKMPQGQQRTEAFNQSRAAVQFTDFALQSYAQKIRNDAYKDRIDSPTASLIGKRAVEAVSDYAYKKGGKAHFRKYNELRSVESKTNDAGIRFRDGKVLWSGLEFECLINSKDKVTQHALNSPIKKCRLLTRELRGKTQAYVQLVLEGYSYHDQEKHPVALGKTVSSDLGPSTIATTSEDSAFLQKFCPEIEHDYKKERQLKRKRDRQMRANNPDNFNPDGTIKKLEPGEKHNWNISKRMKETTAQIRNNSRVEAATRKKSHGNLANQMLEMGTIWLIEKVSYVSFQKNYGRSVGVRAPGMFVALMKQKCKRFGGTVIEFSTYHTKLSQTCLCGRIEKKNLSQRVHNCPDCGLVMQRDLLSSFLALFVLDGILQADLARKAWSSAEPLLQTAWRNAQSASGESSRQTHFGARPRSQSGSSAKIPIAITKAQNVVRSGGNATDESLGEVVDYRGENLPALAVESGSVERHMINCF